MRKKIYKMVHLYEDNRLSILYKWAMMAFIVLSLLVLTTRETNAIIHGIDFFCLLVFCMDYILRWITADYKFKKHHWKSFVRYPFRWIALIDLLSIIAIVCPLFGFFPSLSILKVFRVVRLFRYLKGARVIVRILVKAKKSLCAVGAFALGYLLVSAIVIFHAEPQTFPTFFDALYWSTISLTTVGYGDLYPVSVIGRTIAMLSSFFGIAIVALPAAVVTAEYVNLYHDK